jgi:hypothetical protein
MGNAFCGNHTQLESKDDCTDMIDKNKFIEKFN